MNTFSLSQLASGRLPANVALLHVLMDAQSSAEAEAVIRSAQAQAQSPAEAGRIGAALALLQAHPCAFDLVRDILGSVDHEAGAATPERALAKLAQAFDRAAARSPGGSSALYALGDEDLLTRATHEVVEAMEGWGLLGRGRRMVEVGCGSGRFIQALAPRMEFVLGAEISAVMARTARAQTIACGNADVIRCDGRDLAFLAPKSLDLVLYADSFPYLVQAGGDLAARHIGECARVLKPGGQVLILNLSYREDLDQDRADLATWGHDAGLHRLSVHAQGFALWDAAAFLLSA